jgi:TetR/AcrR family transcriptional regulator, transcriptional repressor for nem operon
MPTAKTRRRLTRPAAPTGDTRVRIIEAAIELFLRGNYAAVGVDAICHAAKVRKGSFYHFFPSKVDLAVAALDHYWQWRRQTFDRIFSPLTPPLDRIRLYFEDAYRLQVERHARTGYVCGCLYFNIGAEVSAREPVIRDAVQRIIDEYCAYFESALRDANRLGVTAIADVPARASELFTYLEGMLTCARIRNDLGLLRSFADGALALATR